MGLILGVLIIGALLSTIFGKHIGAMFVLGTGTVIAICFGILLILLSPLIWDYMHEPSHVQSASNHGDYEPGYSYNTTGNGTAANQSQAQPSDQAQNAIPVQQASVPSVSQATVLQGPSIGIGNTDVPADAQSDLHLQRGYGISVTSVNGNGPAAAAQLEARDVIVSMDGQPITPNSQLADYEARKGAGQPIRLEVYRNVRGRIYHWFPVVTPQ